MRSIRRRFRLLAGMALLFVPVVPLAAQGSTDILTGLVTDERGRPLPGVVIDILSVESQITRTTRTNDKGRYTILFPDGSGQYLFSGYRGNTQPFTETVPES